MPQLLLELFSEEIPARMQGAAARDLERMASERLRAAGLAYEALTTFAGPRRLTLVVEGLPGSTPDRSEELKGPKTSAPEQALEGFLRKTGLTREQLTERDGILYAVIEQKGRSTAELIPEMVEAIIRNFPWPKSMRWGTGTLTWVRPLKRIVCLFDGQVVPFAVEGIASGDVTEGHRFMGSGEPLTVRSFEDYRTRLEANFVLLDQADRKRRIVEGARAVCRAQGLELVEDDGLLEEVSGLAEWPTPILGDMDPSFLDLPPEVIRLSMKTHQKYFAVRDPATGGLAPNFVVVANVEASDGGRALAAGNSRVLSARLNDARFFWDEDKKVGFDAWLKKLEGVTFHAKLETMWDRVKRITALARAIAPLVEADAGQSEQAARLAKGDLASGMVGEFPELQGIMGGYYARAEHGDAIADAIRDHYKPQGPNDTVPTAPLTVAVALADKLDTLVGFFAIGEKPTGSKDPFALRRAALGVIRLLLDNNIKTPIYDLIYLARGQYTATALDAARLDAAYVEIAQFMQERTRVALRDRGMRADIVEASFAQEKANLPQLVRRVEALDAFLATDGGANLLAGHKRANKLLNDEAKKGPLPVGAVEASTLSQPAEQRLAEVVDATTKAVEAALLTEDFTAAMGALSELRGPVDAFLTDVMVNSDVPAERENRLKLLGQVRDVMGRVADFGQVAG